MQQAMGQPKNKSTWADSTRLSDEMFLDGHLGQRISLLYELLERSDADDEGLKESYAQQAAYWGLMFPF